MYHIFIFSALRTRRRNKLIAHKIQKEKRNSTKHHNFYHCFVALVDDNNTLLNDYLLAFPP
jgi:hypothetical protein